MQMQSHARTSDNTSPVVAVVGAGPAGCAAAIALGRAGAHVLLLERGAPGKDKPCGDAFLPSAVELLDRFGINAARLVALGGSAFSQIDLYDQQSRFLRREMGTVTGWMVPRAALDQCMREATAPHATICYQTAVTGITRDTAGQWRLAVRQGIGADQVCCDAVVLACGSGSTLSRHWGISGEPTLAASITGYAMRSGVEAPIFQFLDSLQPGYGWVFPVSGQQVNIGVCALSSPAARRLREHAASYQALWNVEHPCQWRGGGEALWSGRGHTWHHATGIVSCGDAAGLIDPGTGEGITAALLSGQQAGAALSQYLHDRRDARHLAAYSSWVTSHFGRVYRPTLVRQLWDGLCGL